MRSKALIAVVASLVLVGLMLTLTACGSKENEPEGSASNSTPGASQPATPDQAPAQAKVNAAEFFTKADAEAVLGKPVGEPSVQSSGITSNVTYITSDFKGIGVFVRTGTTPTAFDQAQAASKSISGADPAPVAGLGEKAYWSGGKMNQLNILKNGHWLIITIPLGGETSLDLAKQVAEKVLARVP
jgi:hypothetical protein